jgi:hypothetical protein
MLVENVEYMESDSKTVKQYNLTRLPIILMSGEYDVYPFYLQLSALGEDMGEVFVFSKLLPPYYDLTDKKVKGLVKVTYIKDPECKECYAPEEYFAGLLKNASIYVVSEKVLTKDEAKDLLSQYNITQLPTVIMSKDFKYYEQLLPAWEAIGTEEADGMFVLRNNELLQQEYVNVSAE